MIELVIFDHDMTIVNSSYALLEMFNHVARRVGIPETTHELVMKHIADPLPEFCEGVLGDFKREWLKFFWERSEEIERELIKPFPDTVPTLKTLRDMGVKLAVVSNREKPSNAISHEGLTQYFDVIAGAEEPFGKLAYKPAGAMINAVLKYLGIAKDRAVYVGDADIDIITAKNASVRGIGITKGNLEAKDFVSLGAWKVIDELNEIVNIVECDG